MADNDVFTKLPLDVVFQILLKLPTASLLQLRCVSKSFNPLITHPHFLKLHFSAAASPHRHHLIYYESTDYTKAYFSFHVEKSFSPCKILETPFKSVNGYLRIVGSTKGIVCLFDTNYFNSVGTVFLWNPFIGRFQILPRSQEFNCLRNTLSHVVLGFGFDHKNFDFKIVQILYDDDHDLLPKALVYGLKSGYWKSTNLVVPCYMPRVWSSSVFVNGVVHWLAYNGPVINHRSVIIGQPNCIMGFDVAEEGFNSMQLPHNLSPNLNEVRLCSSVDVKSVALFVSYRGNVGEAWDFWLMNDYGNAESWILRCTVVLEQIFFPLRVLNGGDVSVLAAISDEKLVLIDVEKEEVLDLEVCGLPLSFYADDFVPSLVMLDTGDQLPDHRVFIVGASI